MNFRIDRKRLFFGMPTGAAIVGLMLFVTACANGTDPNGVQQDEGPTRADAVRIVLEDAIPAGAPEGDISAITDQTFVLAGKSDFVIGKGSRLKGAYGLDYLEKKGRWRLIVHWYSLDAVGPSRVRNMGRRPPFYTHEELIAPADTAPAIEAGTAWPMRLFNLRDYRNDFDRMVVLGGEE